MSRTALLLLPALLFGCPGGKDDSGGDNGSGDNGSADNGSGDNGSGDNGSGDNGSGDNGSGDNGSGRDTSDWAAFYGGQADRTGTDWAGAESFYILSSDDMSEYCTVTNAYAGAEESTTCDGCDFAFSATWGAGEMTGPYCDIFKLTADAYEGESWRYAFGTYSYSGYEYDDSWMIYSDGYGWGWYGYGEWDGSHWEYKGGSYYYYFYY